MSLLRKIRRLIQRKETAAAGTRDRRKLFLEPLEPRILLSADMQYAMTGAGDDVTLRLQRVNDVETLQIVDSSDFNSVLHSQALAATSGVEIIGTEGDDIFRLGLDFDAISEPFSIIFRGGEGMDSLYGPSGNSSWTISGQDTGALSFLSFFDTENLIGAPDNQDTFVFAESGRLSGFIDGGAGGFDTLDYTQYSYLGYANLLLGAAAGADAISNIENVVGEDEPLLFIHGFGGSMAADSYAADWVAQRGFDPQNLVLDPLMNTYDDLIQSLENVGYQQLRFDQTLYDLQAGKTPLYLANWDWRLPVAPQDATADGFLENATVSTLVDATFDTGLDYLAFWMQKAAGDWFDLCGIPLEAVDVITHSTGGIVARSYIQSAAYGEVFDSVNKLILPKVNDLVQVGVPNEGVPGVWNLLHDNFGEKMSTRLMGIIVSAAYDVVKAGETIEGPTLAADINQASLAAALGVNAADLDMNAQATKVEFIRQYVRSLENLLPTYAFIDVDGTLLTAPEVDSSIENTLLLDLNAGSDPNDFIRLLTDLRSGAATATIVFGDGLDMYDRLEQEQGLDITAGLANINVSFTEILGHLPGRDEIWYQPIETAASGDGTVPWQSAAGNFLADSIRQANGSLVLQDMDATEHSELVYETDAQLAILAGIGVTGAGSGDLSTTLHADYAQAAMNAFSLLTAQFQPGISGDDDNAIVTAGLGQNFLLESAAGIMTLRNLDRPDDSLTFADPAESLRITFGGLPFTTPTLTIGDLGSFSGSLEIDADYYGNSVVVVSQDLSLSGKDLDISAETVTVNSGVTIQAGTITLAAKSIGDETPIFSLQSSAASANVTGAEIAGGDVSITAASIVTGNSEFPVLALVVLQILAGPPISSCRWARRYRRPCRRRCCAG